MTARVSAGGRAIVLGWISCGVLDIVAAFALSWFQAGRGPLTVLRGVASALVGRAAIDGGAFMAAVGLVMHFGVALGWTLVFVWMAGRSAAVRRAPVALVGPLYGAFVFCAMNFAVLPATTWVRSLYLDTAVRWPGGLGWPLLAVHLVCVGTPIMWAIKRGFSAVLTVEPSPATRRACGRSNKLCSASPTRVSPTEEVDLPTKRRSR